MTNYARLALPGDTIQAGILKVCQAILLIVSVLACQSVANRDMIDAHIFSKTDSRDPKQDY
jgi:hypothetical protein